MSTIQLTLSSMDTNVQRNSHCHANPTETEYIGNARPFYNLVLAYGW